MTRAAEMVTGVKALDLHEADPGSILGTPHGLPGTTRSEP